MVSSIGISFDGDAAYIPFTTFQKVYNRADKIDWMMITANDGVDIRQMEKDILLTLKNLHKVHPDDNRAFGSVNLGVEIGKVTDIKISETDINAISVLVSIKNDVSIKEDMYGTMNAIGITGLKYIEITGGTNEAKAVKSGGYIKSKKSPFSKIADQMGTMSYK